MKILDIRRLRQIARAKGFKRRSKKRQQFMLTYELGFILRMSSYVIMD